MAFAAAALALVVRLFSPVSPVSHCFDVWRRMVFGNHFLSLQLVSLPPSPLVEFQVDFPIFAAVVEFVILDPIVPDYTSVVVVSPLHYFASIVAVAAVVAVAVDPTVLAIEEVASNFVQVVVFAAADVDPLVVHIAEVFPFPLKLVPR